MANPKIKSGDELDWEMVKKAARGIIKVAEDAGYKPPEDINSHTLLVSRVCQAMNSITDALKLRKINKHEFLGIDECSLFNSGHAYADGMSWAKCSCGWKSSPVSVNKAEDIWKMHVKQDMNDALVEAAKHGKALADG